MEENIHDWIDKAFKIHQNTVIPPRLIVSIYIRISALLKHWLMCEGIQNLHISFNPDEDYLIGTILSPLIGI